MQKLIDPQQIAMADNRKIKMMGQRIEGMMRELEALKQPPANAVQFDDLVAPLMRRIEQLEQDNALLEGRLDAFRDKLQTHHDSISLLERDQHTPVDIVAAVEQVIKEKGLRPPQKRGPKPKKTQPAHEETSG